MRRLVWADRARRELFEVADYYAQTDPAFAVEMFERIEAAPAPLLEYPEIGSLTTGGARKWRVPKTPYLLLCDVCDDVVEIVAVHHARSNWPR